jgi:DNA gyrase subunit B
VEDVVTDPQRQQTGQDIRALEGLEAVRLRPGMYIGGTDVHALHHLVYEVVDNAIDEAMAGRCDFIQIVIHADSSITISDNGGGIPVEKHWQKGISTLELVLTSLHAGGKFGGGAYKVSGGLHGVGVKAVNAVSEWMVAEVHRDGYIWQQRYVRGEPQGDVEAIEPLPEGAPTGTHIRFYPDSLIFEGVRRDFDFNFKTLADRFREMAYVTRGVTIRLVDERETPLPRETTFYFEGGLRSFVRYLNRNRDAVHDVISGMGESKFTMLAEGREVEAAMEVEFAFQYTETTNTTELAFANTINTPDGGTHQTGLRSALTRVINAYARKAGLLKERDANFTGRHTLEGLTAIVSVRHPAPQFESQTKVKLMNAEVSAAVSSVVSEAFTEFLENNPKEARKIVDKCLSTMRIQDALDKQRELLLGERKSLLANTTLPGKLADCSDRGLQTELFLVEGDSAGGCFVGSTKVRLASGLVKTFHELAEDWMLGITHFGYASNEAGDVRIVPLIEPRLTKRHAELVEVELDNGKRIRCTPDHLFRLRDGSYRAAAQLQAGDSLMPLKTRLTQEGEQPSAGYEMVWMNGRGAWWHTHHLMAERLWQNPEYRQYMRDRVKWQNEAYRLRHIATVKAWLDAYWSDRIRSEKTLSVLATWRETTPPEERGANVREGHSRKALALLNSVLTSENVESAYETLRLHKAPTAPKFARLLQYFEGDREKLLEAAQNHNCKVVTVRQLDEREDVYDLTVDHYHNFALAAGVFVHNSAKQARDRHFQAILPLRGKILNTERATLNRILDSQEIKSLIAALGTGIREDFNVEKLRYGRVLLLTDADVDGAHIRTLLLTFFYRYMPDLIREKRLYIAQPPLFRLDYRKQVEYFYPEPNVREEQLLARALAKYPEPDKVVVQRYKGLGEMNAEQLWETTMNPANRTLLLVTSEDAAAADQTFDMLMGPAVPPRRKFIIQHSKDATLDV